MDSAIDINKTEDWEEEEEPEEERRRRRRKEKLVGKKEEEERGDGRGGRVGIGVAGGRGRERRGSCRRRKGEE